MARPKKPIELPDFMNTKDVMDWLRAPSVAAVRMRLYRGKLPPTVDHPDLPGLLWRRDDLLAWCRTAKSRTRSPQ